jgi:hypothetical protein
LKTDFKDRDPDEGVTDIPYEKGYAFLRTIEETTGRERFDAFMKGYFNSHLFKSLDTEEFLKYLDENLLNQDKTGKDSQNAAQKININAWVYEPGIPSNIPPARSERFNLIDSLVSAWSRTKNTTDLKQLRSTNERLYFIRKLPENITVDDMALLDKDMQFTGSGNAEIQCAWYTLAIRHQYKPAHPNIEKFLTQVGRRKFLLPLYTEMIRTADGKKWAKEIYTKARPNYHSVSYNSIDELLK